MANPQTNSDLSIKSIPRDNETPLGDAVRSVDDIVEVLEMNALDQIFAPAQSPIMAQASITSETRRILDHLLDVAESPATKKSRLSREARIQNWAKSQGLELPVDVNGFAMYIAHNFACGFAHATIRNNVSALRGMNRRLGAPDFVNHEGIRRLMRGIRKTCRPERGKAPIRVEHIKQALKIAQADPKLSRGIRNFAIVCLGFAGAMRCQDIIGMWVEHVYFDPAGRFVRIKIPRSKTDPAGHGQVITIDATGTATCPVAALQRWMWVLRRTTGPVFCRFWKRVGSNPKIGTKPLTHTTINGIVKEFVATMGLEPENFGSHSMRAGFVTEGKDKKIQDVDLMHTTRQEKVGTLYRYDRPDGGDRNVSQRLGL